MNAAKLSAAQRSALVATTSRHGLALRRSVKAAGPIFSLQSRGLVVAVRKEGFDVWFCTNAGRAALRGDK